ncbi:hypothetical protein RHMOL_Rhmol04G0178800 [Rhododendron molle]|uniref:Uncharacterized protein n=1 Tax=Rhododendron molle TaxID=49168 RepID=A0ACC0P2Q8_RHOML|nr:hypothetical protein RHMOL_Rhmol04G0178800 [Rhododendron molle]
MDEEFLRNEVGGRYSIGIRESYYKSLIGTSAWSYHKYVFLLTTLALSVQIYGFFYESKLPCQENMLPCGVCENLIHHKHDKGGQ